MQKIIIGCCFDKKPLNDKKDNTIILKNERVVIVVKKTRLGLADKELGD